jgi:tight adherence protein C
MGGAIGGATGGAIWPEAVSAGLLMGTLALAGSLALMAHMRRERRIRQRLQDLRGTPHGQQRTRPDRAALVRAIEALGTAVARSGLLSAKTIGELEETLVSSGLRGRNGIGLFIGCKLLLLAGVPILMLLLLPRMGFSPATTRLVALVGAALGMIAPDSVVRRNRESYLQKVDRGVPDMLDMLVICAQAGLGLESAMRRVAIEIGAAHPSIATELETTLNEMRIAVDSQRAIANLGTRTGLPSLKRVTSTLVQTLQYGTPLTEALRVLSAEMRQDVLTKFEARAARLPVLLTMPMIIFIFPCIFIVIAGPAALQIIKAFSH